MKELEAKGPFRVFKANLGQIVKKALLFLTFSNIVTPE